MEQVVSYKTLSLHIVTTIGYAFSPMMNKRLYAALVKICTSGSGAFPHSCNDVVVRKMLPV
jgi:hypothetical protein